TKRVPAARLIQIGGIALVRASPATTAMALVATRARAAPANTIHFDRPPAASDSVASWVLSPSSARKTAPKVEAKSFQSMRTVWQGMRNLLPRNGRLILRAHESVPRCIPGRGADQSRLRLVGEESQLDRWVGWFRDRRQRRRDHRGQWRWWWRYRRWRRHRRHGRERRRDPR